MLTQGALLTNEKFAGLAHDGHRHKENAANSDQNHQGEDPGGTHHGNKHHHQGDEGAGGLGDGLADHLPQGINVAGVAAHDIAGGVSVKVAQGQTLHFGEHFITDALLGALADGDHQKLLEEGCQHTNGKNAADLNEVLQQRCVVGAAAFHHGDDVVIHQVAHVLAALGGGKGAGHDAQQHTDQGGDVLLHIA